ncbi:uncharacterized protein LOC134540063 [Bacillus rossius redtenbacheri]|uniref:uncharacterized protein LOC134540063 n=1 Tax=Bacillus rossius redtenbacheri TaxID=93214 RepID=UPI002FDD980C
MAAEAGRTCALRSAVLVALVSVVTTIIYLTPVPDVEFASCERTCKDMDLPMICRIKLTFEVYQTLSRSCGDCPRNSSDCDRRFCIAADGVRRGMLAVNRQLPGPTIQVCQNDILLVDVVNRIPGQELAVHWRGQPQRETPVMDGVPMVTQCPIPSYTTFQYRFRASQPGTHLWHAHTSSQMVDGLFGALVVRRPPTTDPLRHLYDVDDERHLVVISDWGRGPAVQSLTGAPDDPPAPAVLLVNGRAAGQGAEDSGTTTPHASFSVRQGLRYRLRLAYTGGTTACPVAVTLDGHQLLVVALDGSPVAPRAFAEVTLSPGERLDAVLHANQPNASYWLRASTNERCASPALRGKAVVTYEGADPAPPADIQSNSVDQSEEEGLKFQNSVDASCRSSSGGKLCLDEIKSTVEMPEELSAPQVDTRLYLSFGFKHVVSVSPSLAVAAGLPVPHVNNISFTYPPQPLVSQPRDAAASGLLCDEASAPASCHEPSAACECAHVIAVPLGHSVEIVLLHLGDETKQGHVFHLHGHSFRVVGAAQLAAATSLEAAKEMDAAGQLLRRNLDGSPVLKDTITVPEKGVVALRFKADNPGYWLLHEERVSYWMNGLSVVLHVGQDWDLPSLPSDFPTCGSWVLPDMSLI